MRLVIDAEACTGCGSCMLACSFAHTQLYDFKASRVHIRTSDPLHKLFKPQVCIQCPEPVCVKACPVGALSKDAATGAIYVDANQCIRCGVCSDVCPFSAITWREEDGLPLMCDLCGGDPECVKVCRFPQAIRAVP